MRFFNHPASPPLLFSLQGRTSRQEDAGATKGRCYDKLDRFTAGKLRASKASIADLGNYLCLTHNAVWQTVTCKLELYVLNLVATGV